MKEDFATEDLRKTLEQKRKDLARLNKGMERLCKSIAKGEADIKSLEDALKKCGKKEGKK